MTFDELLDRVFYYDIEIFAHDSLVVFISHKTKERFVFHNSLPNDIQNFLDLYNPILVGYNCNNYDKWILKCWLAGYTPEELKKANDYIIGGGKGWNIDCGYIKLPIHWDLFNEINPRKSLKECEGALCLNITETTIPFDLPTKWTKEEYEEVLYYCTCDVKALIPLFQKLITDYKSKYIIANVGHIDPAIALSYTNTKLTAVLLGAKRQEHNDPYKYVYPKQVDKTKIPKEALEYIDDLIKHNDFNYKREAPLLQLKDVDFQIGEGGGHAFKKKGVYIYDKNKNERLLCNFDVSSLYPNIVRLFGYSSRNQSDKDGFIKVLEMRMKSKKNLLDENFLKSINVTNADLKIGLKLPIVAYTGGLRAEFSELYDPLQGLSICVTGQLLLLQLIHDLEKLPTLEMVSANTDAVMFEIDKSYKQQALDILNKWQEDTGLELEEDNIVRIIMKDVNNYCELVQTGNDDYAINYKGEAFEANSIEKNLKVTWNKNTHEWETQFDYDVKKKGNKTIVGEALLKKLLLDIPVEETINNCDDIFRYQIISHLGSTYEKCVQESENGDIELQRNNRIYAGLKPSGKIVKVKADGRRDSLANCPKNPIIDNGNKLTINDINKEWYIEEAKKRVNDFLGIQRIESMKKDELLNKATELGIRTGKKVNKDELIKLIKNQNKTLTNMLECDRINNERGDEIIMATKQELEEKLNEAIEQNEKLVEKIKNNKKEDVMDVLKEIIPMTDSSEMVHFILARELERKIQMLRSKIRDTKFILDKELPNNLGGGEYHSVGQYYDAIQTICLEIGLDFSFEVVELIQFDKDCTKPTNGLPIHVATVRAIATLTDITTGHSKKYITIAQGSDTIDKAVSGAETMAFRQWFTKNFTPKNVSDDEDIPDEQPKSQAPKTPVYIPEKKKEELKKEVVKQKQQEETDDEDIQEICETIMKIRELTADEEYGEKTMQKLLKGTLNDVEIEKIKQKVKNKLEKVEVEING